MCRSRLVSLNGNLGTGAFDNDDALGLLDWLARHTEARRRQTLEQIIREAREYPGDLSGWLSPREAVAATASRSRTRAG